ncbi:hypothetical protein [Blastopirellula marina]|uniref:Uncharacterized protein n=1 Tax=Blastopirellula marina TaxID=124 RepID=A0A2S8FHA8_9BACT|nr:hypothetical protein [Blastopirellula marina]PQO31571.1 hypothetical protein C5Y98_19320 [Blastopirellula marina]PTL42877.1 hypothetical protein C5Y97_19330 [Blastopirellula marina]
MKPLRKRANPGRRGFVGVMVLVTMVAAVLIATYSLQRVTRQSQMRRNQSNPQTSLLMESAVSLVKARLISDPGYSGETWNIPAEPGSLDLPAEVVIAVRPHEQIDLKSVEIQVKLGDEAPRVSRESLQLTLPLPQSEQDK